MTLPPGIAVLEDLDSTLELLQPAALIAQMDEAGISQSVLYAVDAPIVYASNDYVSHCCSLFPDRLIGFASVDPNAGEAALVELERAVCGLGLKGLKLHPPLQHFFPNDQKVFPIYELAAKLNIPVVFHVGTTPFGPLCRLSHADPILIDDVASEFPNLRIMLTHLGTLWHCEAFMVVEKNPNVFIDTAAYVSEIPQILTPELITRVGAHKIIFGTDYPMPYAKQTHRMKDFVEAIRALGLPENVQRAFFSENFELLLHGNPETAKGGQSLIEMIDRIVETRKGK